MAVELIREKYSGSVNTVEIGRPGGKTVKIGGQGCLPFLFSEGGMPNRPVVALEIFDCEPVDWPKYLKKPFGGAVRNPVEWARKCVQDFGAEILCVQLVSAHPDTGNRPVDEVASGVKAISDAVGVPMVITGCGDNDKDNELLPRVSQALKGANCLLGIATQNNYKTLAATCLADGHSIIAESPIDINIAKQVNILISDMGFDPKRIVMHPTTTSLGYGMEYVYSIMERARLAAFIGDRMLAMPFVLFVGQEAWKTKEARESNEVQAVNWEITTAVSMLQAGADLIVLRHPGAAKSVKRYIEACMKR